jgi:hypothetical protein
VQGEHWHRERVNKGLHWGLTEAPAALMRSPIIVLIQPGIEIGLQLADAAIDPTDLVQDAAMEAFADAVGLRSLGLGTAVIDILDRDIELVFMALGAANSVLRSVSIREIRMPSSS